MYKTRRRHLRRRNTRRRGGMIGNRIAATRVLLDYHQGNLDQPISALVPLLEPITTDTIVWRGFGDRLINPYPFSKELETKRRARVERLTSTATTINAAVNFCKHTTKDRLCSILKIHLPKGFPTIDVLDRIRRTKLAFPGEKEILLLPEVNGKHLTFTLRSKTISPAQRTPDTDAIQSAIYKDQEEAKGLYWYEHPTRNTAALGKRFVIYDVDATYE